MPDRSPGTTLEVRVVATPPVRVPFGASMAFLKQIETLFRTGTAGGLTDGRLLERFLERRDEVARQPSRTRRTARGDGLAGLPPDPGDETDAEDAAQATFLVLVRAGQVDQPARVSRMLVARSSSSGCGARRGTAAARRRVHEQRGGEMRSVDPLDPGLAAIENHEDWAKLHDELARCRDRFASL